MTPDQREIARLRNEGLKLAAQMANLDVAHEALQRERDNLARKLDEARAQLAQLPSVDLWVETLKKRTELERQLSVANDGRAQLRESAAEGERALSIGLDLSGQLNALTKHRDELREALRVACDDIEAFWTDVATADPTIKTARWRALLSRKGTPGG